VAKIHIRADGAFLVRVVDKDGCTTDNIFRDRAKAEAFAQRVPDSGATRSQKVDDLSVDDLVTLIERSPVLQARFRELWERDQVRRHGDELQKLPTRRDQDRKPAAPMVISRLSERAVYDLDYHPTDPVRGNRELVDRARRANELATFPSAKRADQDDIRAHVDRLLDRSDRDFSKIKLAQHIMVTGSIHYRSAFEKLISAHLSGYPDSAALTSLEDKSMRQLINYRAMTVGTGSQGGFAVPYQLDPTVLGTSNLSVNPYRAVCRVETITGNQWAGVTGSGITAAYQLEGAEVADTSATLAQPVINVQGARAFAAVSYELAQDLDLGVLGGLIQDAKDDLEAQKFSTGTGTNEPQGLITGATNTVTGGGGAGAFVVGDLNSVENALPARFRPRAVWFANKVIYQKARNFDTGGGAGVWLPDLAGETPANSGYQLNGYPANEVSGMVSTLTTGSKIAVLGDPRYFPIVDRVGMDIEVVQDLFGAANRFPTGQRGLLGFWRNSSQVLNAAAFRVLVTA
jgi:HK97 family phage major capsid protein